MLTITGWEKRIATHPEATHLSKGQRQRMATRVAERARSVQNICPDDLIRNVLVYKDQTGEIAVGFRANPDRMEQVEAS